MGYEPYAAMFNEWWKQLFGESEGKDQRGIFPASVIFSTDLHSLGQYIQDGMRTLLTPSDVSQRYGYYAEQYEDGEGRCYEIPESCS